MRWIRSRRRRRSELGDGNSAPTRRGVNTLTRYSSMSARMSGVARSLRRFSVDSMADNLRTSNLRVSSCSAHSFGKSASTEYPRIPLSAQLWLSPTAIAME